MVYKIHYIELYINKQKVELESQESLGIRLNNTLYDPTKIRWENGEYSYSFKIPATPNNNKILDYANNLSKLNKFHTRYDAQVYADGNKIFDGSLTISKYNGKDKEYECNLVSIKVATFDELFGEETLNQIPWSVPFEGATTINEVNANSTSKYFFPFVSYGAFQKKPMYSDEVGNEYSSKFDMDMYNKWWIESFYPSLNVLEQLKKAFEWKGFKVVGSAFDDDVLNNIYSSCNLADEQQPLYNLGSNIFGNASISVLWSNKSSVSTSSGRDNDTNTGRITSGKTTFYLQDLSFPYEYVEALSRNAESQYNFDEICIWNMMETVDRLNLPLPDCSLNVLFDTYMYDPNDHMIVIPADGFYRINLEVTATLLDAGSTFRTRMYKYVNQDTIEERNMTIKKDFKGQTPFEIQLVKNYNDNIELIKGRINKQWRNGDSNDATMPWGSYSYTNLQEWYSEYPHEELYGAKSPTVKDLKNSSSQDPSIGARTGTSTNGGHNYGGNRAPSAGDEGSTNATDSYNMNNSDGFMRYQSSQNGTVMLFDPAVSPAFICGFSTMNEGQMAVVRNGKSVYRTSGQKNNVFCQVPAYYNRTKTYDWNNNQYNYSWTPTSFGKNEYRNTSNYFTCTSNRMTGKIQCCVELKKNDVLELLAVTRAYEGCSFYGVQVNCTFQITAMSQREYYQLASDPDWSYNSLTEFPKELNLSEFCNKETKISEWIDNISTAFNLSIHQDGDVITIDKNSMKNELHNTAINIDDRVNSSMVESSYIEYPRDMSVQYSINTDEWGYELTVPSDKINLEDWFKYGDSGFTVVKLNDDAYVTSTQNLKVPFSYTYYDTFRQIDYTNYPATGVLGTYTIPVIEESQYMFDGALYEEAMAHDGYGLSQRFWFRNGVTTGSVYTSDYMHIPIFLAVPVNEYMGVNLSYKINEKSLLTEYFNINSRLESNYVTVNVYLSPEEYNFIKSGGYVHLDSDLYIPISIEGYDPSGANTTKLKLMKKTTQSKFG